MVGRIHGQFEFGVAAIGHPLPLFAGGAAAADVVRTAVTAVQARRVEGSAADAAPSFEMVANGGGQQAACPRHTQQPATGLLQGGEVGHTAKAEEAT